MYSPINPGMNPGARVTKPAAGWIPFPLKPRTKVLGQAYKDAPHPIRPFHRNATKQTQLRNKASLGNPTTVVLGSYDIERSPLDLERKRDYRRSFSVRHSKLPLLRR
jgi:hypothetical protein